MSWNPQEGIQLANLLLNFLVIPVVAFLWKIATSLSRLTAIIEGHEARLERAERVLDSAAREGKVERRGDRR